MKSHGINSHLVPALLRGVSLLRELEQAGEATLETLASRCRVPKASALRLLRTLVQLGIVQRDESTKAYRPAMRLVPVASPGVDFARRVSAVLVRLATVTGCTAEWYVPTQQGMVLTQRHEPDSQQVHVVARIGFVRAWEQELDAVAAAAGAGGGPAPSPSARYWAYGSNGVRQNLSASAVRTRLAAAARTRVARDVHYNTNGVKRIAAAVTREGQLVGVLALAHGYQPGSSIDYDALAATLKDETEMLTT